MERRLTKEHLEALIPPGLKSANGHQSPLPPGFDMPAFLTKHDIGTHDPESYKGGFKYTLLTCPLCGHTDTNKAAVFVDKQGNPGFHCFHNNCTGKKWHDFLECIEPGSFNCTDLGNAERFAAQHGSVVRWCETWKSWMVFNGKCWEKDQKGLVDRFAKATVRSIYKEAAEELDKDRRTQLRKHAGASESNRSVRAMLDRAKSELPAMPDDFNVHLHLINCNNGTLDLSTGELHQHNPKDMLTRCLKYDYNPLAACPRWLRFLGDIFADNADLIHFVQQALGMTLAGDIKEQCWFLCYGEGNNGKTTMLEVVRLIIESYGLAANIETFQARKGDHINNDVAEFYGKRMVTSSENQAGSRLNEAFLKKVTGGEPLRARRLHENEFQFMPECTIWLSVNHKPIVLDTSKGMWRRVRFIPFTVTIADNQVDTNLPKKLMAEAEGILAWLVQGCLSWYRQGRLNVPKIVQDSTQSYRAEMDIMARFFEEECLFKDGEKTGSTALKGCFEAWCIENGEKFDAKMLKNALNKRGYFSKKIKTGWFYHGITLSGPKDDLPPPDKKGDGGDGGDGESGVSSREENTNDLMGEVPSPTVTAVTTEHKNAKKGDGAQQKDASADWYCVTCGAGVEDFSHIDIDGSVHEQPDVPYCLVHKPSEDLSE